jgi:hypothetical protein
MRKKRRGITMMIMLRRETPIEKAIYQTSKS